MKNTPQLILENLIYNEEYSKRVLPHLKTDYFSEVAEKKVFDAILKYAAEYSKTPSVEALFIDLKKDRTMTEDLEKSVNDTLSNMKLRDEKQPTIEWLIENTESYCKERAIFNGLKESVEIYESKGKKSVGAIPEILRDALSVSFDTSVGHNYIEDAEKRFEYYNSPKYKIPFRLDYLNKITQGGCERKKLNTIVAGCVDENTKVKIRFRKKP